MSIDQIRVWCQTRSGTGEWRPESGNHKSCAMHRRLARLNNQTDGGYAIRSRIVSSMRKLNRALAKCENCGIIFSIDNSEYIIWSQNNENPSAFHSRECMIEYRETHKVAHAMKKRILDLNKQGKITS